ncbi:MULTISPECIES: hypothetical protein [Moraxella]|nr:MULTISPECIES: hypothetical protein [Moraxella]ARE66041.1 hypothetical protein MC195_04585 [Moraxella catarrhalis]EGE10995.1 hypothetical protein E9G_05382 [Moraxella catarrhalis 7169]EGE12694.1 hypothetical protein E9M_05315 [Moraxella catarrhalis 46P47B1]EGE18390.1 hypothetical protein E9Q_04074 [Moraxella catarrhalis BC1]EGE20688.1 hypothetical protein E9U_03073 [Moraxella catarrhalis BC8]
MNMISIKYRINEKSLMDNYDDILSKPIIYGVFIIESDFEFYLRDKCMIDDGLFELFKFNDDLFDWFFNLNKINIELMRDDNKYIMLGYDLDSAYIKNYILFTKNNQYLKISIIECDNQDGTLKLLSKKLPDNYRIINEMAPININIWLEEIYKKTKQFLDDITSIYKDFDNYIYIKKLNDFLKVYENNVKA